MKEYNMKQSKRRTFTAEVKKQMVQLSQNGKQIKQSLEEYDLTPSALDKWIKQEKNSGVYQRKR